jgi:hypothetical protein
VELYLHSPNTHSRRGAQLKHRDSFTFTTGLGFNLLEIKTYCYRINHKIVITVYELFPLYFDNIHNIEKSANSFWCIS